MAAPRKLVRRAARQTATSIGYTLPQARAYAKTAVQTIAPAGRTTESRTYFNQIKGVLSRAQRRKVRRYDRTG